jgi:cysteine synthase A
MKEQTAVLQQLYGIPAGAARKGVQVAAVPARCKALKHMIGNTPPLAIRFLYRGKERGIYAKAEQLNLTGSIKDRMALHILKKAYQEIASIPATRSATSGNTGISFAAIGRALGHQVVIFMPDWMSQERLVNQESRRCDCPGASRPGWLRRSICMTEELAENRPHVFPGAVSNEANVEATRNHLSRDLVAAVLHRSGPTRLLPGSAPANDHGVGVSALNPSIASSSAR